MTERGLAFLFFLIGTVVLQAFAGRTPKATSSTARLGPVPPSSVSIGGEPAVVLTRPQPVNRSEPQFLGATVLPGNGMNLLQISAYVPGLGDIDLLDAPDLAGAKDLLENQNDAFGNKSFSKIGRAHV